MDTTIDRTELDFLARRAGLALTGEQAEGLVAVYPKIRAMAARVRRSGGEGRGREAEPSHVFVPGEP